MCDFTMACAFVSGRRAWMSAAVVLVSLAVAVGCSPTANTRGNIPLKESVEIIEKGKQNQDEVLALLGSPSTMATFGARDVWYYIGERTETLAFFEPKLLERKILVIKFDKQGLVENVASYDASAGKEVQFVDRVTPTKGKELGFLQQIIGNVGRFSKPEEDGGALSRDRP
jgi:outer membrane protein assembly factor BamE (lipoprotein component of BamABCDE complex)